MSAAGEWALRLRDVHKAFGACVANEGASLEVKTGHIHALVGENGAGKSTLMRTLAGMITPDRGRIEAFGRDVTGWSPADAIAAGVGMVHQHFMLVPTLTVTENVVLGREPKKGLVLDLARARADVEKLCEEAGLHAPADALVGELSVGVAQRVEILKVLHRGARILVLDEPTAVLSPPEVGELFDVLRRLRDRGSTVVIITHKLDEVMALSDRITVMRRGRTVGELVTADTTPAEIAALMVGRELGEPASLDAEAPSSSPAQEGLGLRVEGLVVRSARGTKAVDGLSFEVRPGEILGVAGVEGNGQSELVEALAGLRSVERGRVSLGDVDLSALGVRERVDAGLAHIPDDRHRRGLVLDFSVEENLILGRHDRYTRRGLFDRARVRAFAEERIAALDIRPTDPGVTARSLSGGNQQKIVVGREMGHPFRVLLAAQPTRGVDIGAVELIHRTLLEARANGKAILLVSAELSEILALSDRVAVLYRGRFVTVLPRAEATAEVLGPAMTGASARPSAAEAVS
jgi:simple sugar transport system ATP-binding protein